MAHKPVLLVQDKNCRFDSRTLKKLLTPVAGGGSGGGGGGGSESPLTSPEMGRRGPPRTSRGGSYDSDREAAQQQKSKIF